jgi:hypothetical protein
MTKKNAAIKSWADIGHAEREQLADDMIDAGLLVKVERFGTGNAKHSGSYGCGVAFLAAVPNRHLRDDCACGCKTIASWEDIETARLAALGIKFNLTY